MGWGVFKYLWLIGLSRDRNHGAWSHVISVCEGKLVNGQIVPRLEANEIMSVSRLGSNGMEGVRRTKHLQEGVSKS